MLKDLQARLVPRGLLEESVLTESIRQAQKELMALAELRVQRERLERQGLQVRKLRALPEGLERTVPAEHLVRLEYLALPHRGQPVPRAPKELKEFQKLEAQQERLERWALQVRKLRKVPALMELPE